MYYNGHKVRYINDYPCIYLDGNTTVYLHKLVMEEHLGRKLDDKEVIHHCDENRANYSLSNLWLFRSKADHTGYHNGLSVEYDSTKNHYFCPDLNIKSKCPICGGSKDKTANMCMSCYNKRRHLIYKQPSKKPCRLELKNLIRSKSFCEIGRMFNVSDNAVRKWCKSYNLPYNRYVISSISDEDWKLY